MMCKAFLLYEIKKILPKLKWLKLIDLSIPRNAPNKIKSNLICRNITKGHLKKIHLIRRTFACLYNLEIDNLVEILKIQIPKKIYNVESYRNEDELFNLQCWPLT